MARPVLNRNGVRAGARKRADMQVRPAQHPCAYSPTRVSFLRASPEHLEGPPHAGQWRIPAAALAKRC